MGSGKITTHRKFRQTTSRGDDENRTKSNRNTGLSTLSVKNWKKGQRSESREVERRFEDGITRGILRLG